VQELMALDAEGVSRIDHCEIAAHDLLVPYVLLLMSLQIILRIRRTMTGVVFFTGPISAHTALRRPLLSYIRLRHRQFADACVAVWNALRSSPMPLSGREQSVGNTFVHVLRRDPGAVGEAGSHYRHPEDVLADEGLGRLLAFNLPINFLI
jgi:hypothetical protein